MAGVTTVTELFTAGRIVAVAIRTTVGVAVAVTLWTALYGERGPTNGVSRDQAVAYAVLALLITSLRLSGRSAVRDTLSQHVASGSVLYWFIRPLAPRRYYALRAIGDLGYAAVFPTTAALVLVALGVIEPPATVAASIAFVLALLLGQVIVYQLNLLLDLICFWTVVNQQVVMMLAFVQTAVTGGFVPLWFFPSWFLTASTVLPFYAVITGPLNLYTGRTTLGAAVPATLVAVGWCVALELVIRLLWRRAARRLTIQGG